MKQSRLQRGFTTIELVLVMVIIGILLTLLINTRSGVQQNQRDNERQKDIKELRDNLEGYYAVFNRYPTLQQINDPTWRANNLKPVPPAVFRDPGDTSSGGGTFTDKPHANSYAYSVTSASGAPCGTVKDPCTLYTLSATLEGGGTFTKNNLN